MHPGSGADDVLLTALVLALARERRGLTDGTTVVREGHGRQEELVPGADLSRTARWSTVTPARISSRSPGIDVDAAFTGGAAAGDALKPVKEQRRALPCTRASRQDPAARPRPTPPRRRARTADDIGFNFLPGPFHLRTPGAGARRGPHPRPPARTRRPTRPGGRRTRRTPAASALELNALVTGTGDDARLTALFTFATGVLTADEVRALSGTWCAALRGRRAAAAFRPGRD